MRRKSLVKIFLVATSVLFGAELALADTLEDALRATYKNNPNLKASRAAVRSQSESIEQARAGLRPQINFVGSYQRSANETADWQQTDMLSGTLNATLLIFDGGQTADAISSAKAAVEAARYNLYASENTYLANAATAYFDVVRDRQSVKLSAGTVGVLNRQIESVRISMDAGTATITDVAQAEASQSSAMAQLAGAEGFLSRSEEQYRAITGLDPRNVEGIGKMPDLPNSLQEAISVAQQKSPNIRAVLELERSAQFDLSRARNAKMPKVNLQAQYGLQNGDLTGNETVGSTSIGVTANVPLYTGGATSSSVRQAEAILERRMAETNAARDIVTQNISIAWANIEAANAQMRAAKALIDAQQLAADSAQIEFEIGTKTIIDKLNAEQDLLSARVSLVSAERDRQVAAFTLLAAMGILDVNNLNLGVPKIDPLLNAPAMQDAPKSEAQKVIESISGRWSN